MSSKSEFFINSSQKISPFRLLCKLRKITFNHEPLRYSKPTSDYKKPQLRIEYNNTYGTKDFRPFVWCVPQVY